MICSVPYVEERFRDNNPDIADKLNQEYEIIYNRLTNSNLFRNVDNTLKLSNPDTIEYEKQSKFIDDINSEYEAKIVIDVNGNISVNVLPLYNTKFNISKPKYYIKDDASVKTVIDIDRLPVQEVAVDINKEILDTITHVLTDLNGKNFNTLIVGGAVRDALIGNKPKDIDIEVYGITIESLEQILSTYGKVDAVGKSFGVLKFLPYDNNGKLVELEEPFDFSVPRRENKVGLGYKGFEVELSDDISIEEAGTRRDFTWNSMGYNPITNTLYDYYGGINDLANGVIRHTSEKFAEDPLRILRAMQFQARMGHTIAPETYELMKSIVDRGEFDHLATNELYSKFLKEKIRLNNEYNTHIKKGESPESFPEIDKHLLYQSMITKERILGEWIKWSTKGKYHSKIFNFLRNSGVGEKLYPELMALRGTQQDIVYHPEGNVEEHTKQVVAKAYEIAVREKLSIDEKQILVFSALLHDISKPETTKEEWSDKLNRFKVTSRGHEQAGEAVSIDILNRIGLTENAINVIGKLVAEHLAHATISTLTVEKQKNSAFLKLVNRLNPANVEQLVMLMEADMLGRDNDTNKVPTTIAEFMYLLNEYKEKNKGNLAFTPILTGKHLMKAGVKPGKQMGEILAKAKEAQLNLDFTDETESLEWLSNYLSTQDDNNIILEDKVKSESVKEKEIKSAIASIREIIPKSDNNLLNIILNDVKENKFSGVVSLYEKLESYNDGDLDADTLLGIVFNKMADKNKDALIAEIKKKYDIVENEDAKIKLGEILVDKNNENIDTNGVIGSVYRGVHNFFNYLELNRQQLLETINKVNPIPMYLPETDADILLSKKFQIFNKNNPHTTEKENLEYFKNCK